VPRPGCAVPRGLSHAGRWLVVPLVLLTILLAAAPVAVTRGEAEEWVVTLGPAALHGEPDEASDAFVIRRIHSPLQILGVAGDWAHVYDPRGGGTAYVRADLLGPGEPPSPYVALEPPAVEEELSATGALAADAPLAFYPTPAEEAVADRLGAGTPIGVDATVRGEDGALWYRTADGYYVPHDVVSLPPPPVPAAAPIVRAAPPAQFAGPWIDVNLTTPARLTAYEGSRPIRSLLVIKGTGRWQTPTGTFQILRRVANETMDSATVGIPRNARDGYYLRNVLFTQYFTGAGHSLHYNYWSSNFGYAGSHGCLGLTYADSAFLWQWAGVGTPISIHY
jgi:L,D-transpeptidase catalytic domain